MKAQNRKTQNKTKIEDYIDPDVLCIEIRKQGGGAYVERQNGRDVLITDQSLAWVRKLCKEINFVAP